jgi:hypothetical protein
MPPPPRATVLCSHAEDTPGFVDSFDQDIFISYAHLDRPWVDAFHAQLLAFVEERAGKHIRIWRDPVNDGATAYADTIREKVSNSAIFLAVVSPALAGSRWCHDEAAAFHHATADGRDLLIDKKSRVLRVLKTKLYPGLTEPSELRPDLTTGFDFIDVDADNTPTFRQLVRSLGDVVFSLLLKLKNGRTQNRKQVYLALVNEELSTERADLEQELTKRGYAILPASIPAFGARSVIQTAMASAIGSIHMIGDRYGPSLEDEKVSLVELQHSVASERRRRGDFQEIVWLPSDKRRTGAVEDLVSRIRRMDDASKGAGLELIEGPFQNFTSDVPGLLAAAGPPTPPKPRSVFLLYDRQDMVADELLKLREHLDNKDIAVDEPVFQAQPGEIRLAERLKIASNAATIIYYGGTTDYWIDQKISAVVEAPVDTVAASQARRRAIYLCVPADDVKQSKYLRRKPRFIGRDGKTIHVLGDCGPFRNDDVDAFLNELLS